MKNGLGEAAVERIANALAATLPGFHRKRFIRAALYDLELLELKDRVRHIIKVLHQYLPSDFVQTAEILIRVKKHWDPGAPDDNLAGFAAWPIIDYIGEYGLDHPDESLKALKELTSMFSAEFSIRPFIINHFDRTYTALHAWADDPDQHVRRLASEGSRPRLPWGQQLPQFIKDPTPLFDLLEKLKDDPSDYVRRSVANNLNDISKDHPEKIITLCKVWKKGAGKEREWMIRHATRTLVKAGHPAVFGLLGYTENPKLTLLDLETLPKAIKLGESITFSFKLQSTNHSPQSIVIDYAIHHRKANGQTTPKVFKFKPLNIKPKGKIELTKRHAIKAITTRKYYSGEHAIEILINGRSYGTKTFTLIT